MKKSSPTDQSRPILSGWKEIANYMGKGVRTVQRYERYLALPVRRPAGSAGSVLAIQTEIDGWFSGSPVRIHSLPKRSVVDSRARKVRANFLQIDSEFALTFAGMALGASNQETRRRVTITARRAYDTILRLRDHVHLVDVEKDRLDANLRRLKDELQRLGQRF